MTFPGGSPPQQPGTEGGPGSNYAGYQYQPQGQPAERTGRAVTALVLGIIGIFTLITAPFAVGFGIAALRLRQTAGKGMAIAGLVLGILGSLVLVIVVAAVAAATASGPSKLAGPSTSSDAPSQVSSSSPSGSSSFSGPTGTSFKVTDGSNAMDVTLTKVVDPAQGADQFTTPDGGKRFVGAVFKLKGVMGSMQDDANSDATLIGSNGQTHEADFDNIAGYTNFNSGEFNLRTGEKSIGAIVFQVPLGVKVSKIEWSATDGFGGQPAEWIVH